MNGWINNIKTHYLYRYIRTDKDEPFYIGKGTSVIRKGKDNNCYSDYYNRAMAKCTRRNNIFELIRSKTPYTVDIIYETQNYDEINEKEKEFIKLYGRIDIKTGTLCNLTNGGDGIDKHGAAFNDSIKRRKENGTYKRIGHINSRPVFIYNSDGSYLIKYKSKKELAKVADSDMSVIFDSIRLKRSFMGYYLSNKYYKGGINVSNYTVSYKRLSVLKINKQGIVVGVFDNRVDAIKSVNGKLPSVVGISSKLNKERYGFLWKSVPNLKIYNDGKYNLK